MPKLLNFLANFSTMCHFKNVCAAICAALILIPEITVSQSVSSAPARSAEVVDALEGMDWKVMDNSAEYIGVTTSLGVRLDAFRFQPEYFEFSIVPQKNANGETVASIGKRENAYVSVNGGFFARNAKGHLRPVGLLRIDGKTFSKAWTNSGGFLVIENVGLSILPTRSILSNTQKNIVQSRPVIIEQGGKWALNTNLGNIKNRTLVCVQKDSKIIILTITGQGLSLFEAGWILRSEEWGGRFDCDSAIALDGGGSTQLYVANKPSLNFEGNTNVVNAFVVKRR